MMFDEVLTAMYRNQKCSRRGWNGKGVWIAFTPSSTIARSAPRRGAAAHFDPNEPIAVMGHIDMRAADGVLVIGWTPSQTDLQADDWMVLP